MQESTLNNDLQIDNLPNRLTIFRMLIVPIVIALLGLSSSSWIDPELSPLLGQLACAFFVIAAITDFFDGLIARRRNIITVFGSFLDPIADKFLTVSSLIMLMGLGRIETLIVIVLVLREMYMTSLRLLALNEGVKVPVSSMGKWKTTVKMIGIPMLMLNETWYGIPFHMAGRSFLYLATILSVWSAISYSVNMVAGLKLSRMNKKRLKKELKLQKKKTKSQD